MKKYVYIGIICKNIINFDIIYIDEKIEKGGVFVERNSKIFLVFLATSICMFSYSLFEGRKQVGLRKDDYIKYRIAKDDISKGENIQAGIDIFDDLDKRYPQTDVLKRDKATGYLSLGKYDKAQECLDEAFEVNPRLYNQPTLMLAYAETADVNGDTEKVKELLQKIEEVGIPEESKNEFDNLYKKNK